MIKQKEQDIQKYKGELVIMQEQIDAKNDQCYQLKQTIEQMQKDIQTISLQNRSLHQKIQQQQADNDQFKEENIILKNENYQLKKKLEDQLSGSQNKQLEDIQQLQQDIIEQRQMFVQEINKIKKEYELKLQEQKKQIQGQRVGLFTNYRIDNNQIYDSNNTSQTQDMTSENTAQQQTIQQNDGESSQTLQNVVYNSQYSTQQPQKQSNIKILYNEPIISNNFEGQSNSRQNMRLSRPTNRQGMRMVDYSLTAEGTGGTGNNINNMNNSNDKLYEDQHK